MEKKIREGQGPFEEKKDEKRKKKNTGESLLHAVAAST